jgi:hypothetical protein
MCSQIRGRRRNDADKRSPHSRNNEIDGISRK